MKFLTLLFIFLDFALGVYSQRLLLELKNPIVLRGNDSIAYRDPAVLFHENTFWLFFTLVEIEKDGKVFSYTAMSRSDNLISWSLPKKITPRDQNLNYSSPGNIIRFGDEWIMCLQTYPRPNHYITQPTYYGNKNSRIFIMRSKDLNNWEKPEIVMVKGRETPVEDMGRMIDPFLFEDKDEVGKFWCFFKQNGVSMSYSYDLVNWIFQGNTKAGENVCVLVENDEYVLFHSPQNGIGIMRSSDLKKWEHWGKTITLGQNKWKWAQGRITAGVVVNLTTVEEIENYVMFFHGSGPLSENEGDFDKNASIGIAWSKDFLNWNWPGK